MVYPTKRDPERVARILERVAEGVLLAKVLRMPDVDLHPSTFWDWRQADPALESALRAAQEHGYDVIAAQSLDIVDGLAPVPGVPNEASRDKARADHRLKLLAKFDPKRYGDKVQVADADGGKLEASPLVLEVMALLRPQGAQESLSAPVRVLPQPEPR